MKGLEVIFMARARVVTTARRGDAIRALAREQGVERSTRRAIDYWRIGGLAGRE